MDFFCASHDFYYIDEMVNNIYVLTKDNAEFVTKTPIPDRKDWYLNLGRGLIGKLAPHSEPLPVFGPEKRPCETNTPPPAKKARQIRRPCGFCPKKPDASRLSTFCYICSIPVCKDHRHYICDSCSEKN